MAYGSYGQGESKCRSCGARIIFIKSTKGHFIPCNPTVTRYRKEDGGKEKIVLDTGEVVSCRTDIAPEEMDGVGYVSHFATCPNAKCTEKGSPEDKKQKALRLPGKAFHINGTAIIAWHL